ncbi:MAG: Ser-Thr-rich GPI-anchored membrane family protein [Candidatus Pacebacteria bacterium]|nr:Ser-Thr-rich GPI-anchored membrane family protein [Candidatus Paceibacterota bacterium]
MYKHLEKEITLSLLSLVILFSIAFISTVSTQAQVTTPVVSIDNVLVYSGNQSVTNVQPGNTYNISWYESGTVNPVNVSLYNLVGSQWVKVTDIASVSPIFKGQNGVSWAVPADFKFSNSQNKIYVETIGAGGQIYINYPNISYPPTSGITLNSVSKGTTDGYQFFDYTISSSQQFNSVTFTISCNSSEIDVSTKGGGSCGEVLTNGLLQAANSYVLNIGYKVKDSVSHLIGLSVTAQMDSVTVGSDKDAITVAPISTGGGGGGGSTGTPCYVFSLNMTTGSTGADVTALQQFLATNGFLSKEFITGYFGPQTLEAVKLYQTSVGLPSYGFVGPLTIQKLNASCAAGGTTTTTNPIKISFYSPKKGDVLKVGQKYNVIWFSDKVANDSTFTITEFNDYGKGNIAENLTRDQVKCYGLGKGSCVYSWTPKIVSSKYQLAISQVNNGAKGQVAVSGIGYSEFFSTASSTKNENSSIKLLNLNGGEVLNANKGDGKVTIKWKSTGAAETANVQIGLIDIRYSTEAGERPEQIIAYSIPNTGSYDWAIPRMQGTMDLTVTDKPVYKIILHSWATNKGNAIADASAKPFTIIAPDVGISTGSINVTYPQAGNVLDNSGAKDSGLIARIKWNSKGLGDHMVGIVLVNPSANNTSIAKTIVATAPNTGTFDWKYDASIPNGTYAIQVYDAWSKGGSVQGTSGYFQIVNSPASAQPVITRVSAKAAEDFTVYPGESFFIEGKNFAMANKGDTTVYFAYNGKDVAQVTQIGDTLIGAIAPSDLPVGTKVNLYVVNAGRVSEPAQVTVGGVVVPPVTPFVNLLVSPTYSNGNQTVGIWAAIKGDANNKNISKWALDITCSSGITMRTPDQKELCNTVQTYYSSYYYDVTQDILLLTVDANNNGTIQSTNPNVTFVLTGYDANGSSFGSDKEVVSLGFTNSPQPVTSTGGSSGGGSSPTATIPTATTITTIVSNPTTPTVSTPAPVILPTINSISPTSGPAGTTVTITGYGFVTGSVIKATVGGFTTKITPKSISGTQVVGVVPSFATPGVYSLQVYGEKQSSNTINFTVTKNMPSAAVWDAVGNINWLGASFNQ